jgi:hypothetical protein
MDTAGAIQAWYTGAGANPQVIVENGGTQMRLLVGGDTLATVDLSKTTDNTNLYIESSGHSLMGNLTAYLPDWHFIRNDADATPAGRAGDFDDTFSYCLADQTVDLSDAARHYLTLDRTLNGRFYTEGIINSKAYLEGIVGGGYTVKSFKPGAPYTVIPADARTMLKTAGFTSAMTTHASWGDLSSIADIWGIPDSGTTFTAWTGFQGADYAGLSAAQKEVRIRGSARAIAQYLLRNGLWLKLLLLGNATTDESDQLHWFADEFKKCGVRVLSFAEAADYINTHWSCTDGACTRTLTQTYDARVTSQSSIIGRGADLWATIGRTDYRGNTCMSHDIGAVCHQPSGFGIGF